MKKLSDYWFNLPYALRIHKPILIGRLTRSLVRSNLFSSPVLRYVEFALDYSCNLKCKHCFAVALRDNHRTTMNIEQYRSVARQCMALGAVNFSFQGGEPLLFQTLPDIIRACYPCRNLISVTSNGTLLTKAKARELKKIGVDILTMSLDSANAQEHDAFRGVSGSYAKTIEGIAIALASGIKVTLGCVITHQTVRSKGVLDLAEFAKSKKLLLYLILPVVVGRWAGKGDILITDDDMVFIQRLIADNPYVRTDFQANYKIFGCGAVKEILYITPYGDVLPCPFLHMSLGNINEEPIAWIRHRGLQNRFFSSYYQTCLASTDKEFVSRYVALTSNASHLPVRWDDVYSKES